MASPDDLTYWLSPDPGDPDGRTRAQTQRQRAEVSQERAAWELHIAVGTLSKRERGKTVPRGWKATEYVDWLKKLKPKPASSDDEESGR